MARVMVRKELSAMQPAFLLISLLLFSSVVPPISSGGSPGNDAGTRTSIPGFSASICTWKDNLSGALSVTFDDGESSQVLNASPIMSLLDIQGTFFVTIDNVGIPYGATWAQWQTVANNGQEIASHSKTHSDLRTLSQAELWTEVVLTKGMIEDNLTGVSCQTFSYPMGLYNETIMDLVRETYISARQDRHNISAQPGPVPASPADMYSIVPVRFGSGNTASQLDTLVNQTISDRGWLVEMIHAVGEGGYDPVDFGEFTSHMQYAAGAKDRLWIAPFSNISKYIRLRDSAFLNMTHPEDYILDIVLETPLDERDYDIPMTLNISVPSDWIDLEIYRWGAPVEVVHTMDAFDHRYFVTELGANERIRIVQANLNPHIELYEPEPGTGLPFTPQYGDTSYNYRFALNYSSEMNRPPLEGPYVWFDLNGDGDLDDVIGGERERRVRMYKVDDLDVDYTDGCIYYVIRGFPGGTSMKIRFSAVDSDGLEAVSTSGMGDWMIGPILNDPPMLDAHITISSRHSLRPTFSWTPAWDNDNDPITYKFDLCYRNWSVIRSYETNSTNLTLDIDLEFDVNYSVELRCDDGRGRWDNDYYHFNLTNWPPRSDFRIFIFNEGSLRPRFEVRGADDYDHDPLMYHMMIFKVNSTSKEKVLQMSQFENGSFMLDHDLSDHTNYSADFWVEDPFGEVSETKTVDFRCNIPPEPVKGLRAHDLEGEEDGVVILWEPSIEEDVAGYFVGRFNSLHDLLDLYPAAGSFNLPKEASKFIDRNVTDGICYWYTVLVYDEDERVIRHPDILYLNITPIDDVAPLPITNISVKFIEADHYSFDSFMLEWNASSDGRFQGYRIYKSAEPVSSIADLTPWLYFNGSVNRTYVFDFDIDVNDTFYYTVTAIDKAGNEMTTGLTWASATFPYIPPEEPPETPDDDESKDTNYLISGIIVGVILLLLGGISFMVMELLQRRTRYYDEE